jgi:hypothetical protein
MPSQRYNSPLVEAAVAVAVAAAAVVSVALGSTAVLKAVENRTDKHD